MSDIGPIGRLNPADHTPAARQSRPQQPAPINGHSREDSAEISSTARLASLAANPPLRTDLIEQVRAEIQAGTYETEQKIDDLLDELVADLL